MFISCVREQKNNFLRSRENITLKLKQSCLWRDVYEIVHK